MMLSLCAQQRVTLQGPAKDLTAGPVSLPPGIKAANILPLMASDSRLNCAGVLKESVGIGAREDCSTGSTKKGKDRGKVNFKCVGEILSLDVHLSSLSEFNLCLTFGLFLKISSHASSVAAEMVKGGIA